MGSKRAYTLSADDMANYISMPKIITSDIQLHWYTRSPKKSPYGYHQWQSTYILHNNDTVENLYLTLKTIRYDEYDYYSFMLSYKHGETINIIHQLEVYPTWKNSHTESDGTKLYGTHIHNITQTYEIRPPNHETFDWRNWLSYYTQITNITLTGTIIAPYDGELF